MLGFVFFSIPVVPLNVAGIAIGCSLRPSALRCPIPACHSSNLTCVADLLSVLVPTDFWAVSRTPSSSTSSRRINSKSQPPKRPDLLVPIYCLLLKDLRFRPILFFYYFFIIFIFISLCRKAQVAYVHVTPASPLCFCGRTEGDFVRRQFSSSFSRLSALLHLESKSDLTRPTIESIFGNFLDKQWQAPAAMTCRACAR